MSRRVNHNLTRLSERVIALEDGFVTFGILS